MARGRGRGDYVMNPAAEPLPPREPGRTAPQAPTAPSARRMIRKADGTLVPPYDPKPQPVLTFAEILERDAELKKNAGPSWDEFKKTLKDTS